MRGENDNSQTNLSGLSSEEKGASCDDAPLLIAQPEFEVLQKVIISVFLRAFDVHSLFLALDSNHDCQRSVPIARM